LADWVTISQVATAGGTLVLAVATFASIKSANRSARVAERAMLVAQRPILIPSRLDDPKEHVGFGDRHALDIVGHGGELELADDRLYMAIALRNGGAGLAVIHGWSVRVQAEGMANAPAPPLDAFRRQLRDFYIPAQQTGFWQGAIRDRDDPDYASIRAAAESGERVVVDLLYGDHEGGQRAIARFGISSKEHPDVKQLGNPPRAEVLRYYNVDGADPR
jgi:hypothetical protein